MMRENDLQDKLDQIIYILTRIDDHLVFERKRKLREKQAINKYLDKKRKQ